MESIKLRTHVGPDKVLNLRIPVGISEADVEVVVVLQEVAAGEPTPSAEARGWPPDYFEETYGSFRDAPLVRPEQGELETRDPLQ